MILSHPNASQSYKIASSLLGIILAITISGCRSAADSEKTVSQGKIDLGKQEIEYKVKEKPPTTEPAENAPFSYDGRAPRYANAGEPFTCTFSIQNNTDIPIIAASIGFKDCSMIKEIEPDIGWVYNQGGILTSPGISIQNIYVEKSSSLQSKVSLMILEPGTYQFQMLPSVKAGSWRALGAYVFTVIVNDTANAQQTRSNIEAVKNTKKEISNISDEINSVEYDINGAQYDIDTCKTQIETLRQDIQTNQEDLASFPENATTDNQQIADDNKQIQDQQRQLQQAKNKLQELTRKRDSLLAKKRSLESSLSD